MSVSLRGYVGYIIRKTKNSNILKISILNNGAAGITFVKKLAFYSVTRQKLSIISPQLSPQKIVTGVGLEPLANVPTSQII